MNHAYLLTGSNMGDRPSYLQKAAELIEVHCGLIVTSSAVYETAAWGKEDQQAFLNQAHSIETHLTARQLMRKVLKVEKIMGRERKEKYGPRIIDVDILLFNDEIHDYKLLRVPHPELHNRRFALVPLADIGAAIIHPGFHKTISQLLEECKDVLPVKKYA